MMDIITKEHFFMVDGGKIYFYEDGDECGLCNGYWDGEHLHHNSESIKQFVIPNTINGKPVTEIDGDTFDGMPNLEKFVIDENHPYFKLYQGGLYTRDMKSMYHLPPSDRKEIFRVPDTVEYIMDSALSSQYLETIILSRHCKEVYEYGVSCCKRLKRIYLPKSITFIGFKAFIWTSPEKIFYEGSEQDKNQIDFTDRAFNAGILDAMWHYHCNFPED